MECVIRDQNNPYWYYYVDTPAVPLMDQVVVFKSHMGSGGKDVREEDVHALGLGQMIQNDRLYSYSILGIALSPRDRILRNNFWWKDNRCYWKREYFFKKANVLCSSLVELTQIYV